MGASTGSRLHSEGRNVREMKRSLLIVSVVAAVFVIVAFLVGGRALVLEGFNISINSATQSALMLFASFIVIGQIQVLLTKEMLDRWFKRSSGIKGIVVSAVAGGLFPGGPYIYFPFVASFAEKGLPFYVLIAFLLGKNTYDFARFPMEASLIAPNIAIIRNLITLPVPIIIGLLAKRYFGNKTIENVLGQAGEKDATNDRSP